MNYKIDDGPYKQAKMWPCLWRARCRHSCGHPPCYACLHCTARLYNANRNHNSGI